MEENLFLFRRFRLLDQAGKQRVDQQFQEMELTAMQSYVLRYLHDRAGEVVLPEGHRAAVPPDAPDGVRSARPAGGEGLHRLHARPGRPPLQARVGHRESRNNATFASATRSTRSNRRPCKTSAPRRCRRCCTCSTGRSENLSEGKEEA